MSEYLEPRTCGVRLLRQGYVEIPRDEFLVRWHIGQAISGFDRLLNDSRNGTFKIDPRHWRMDEMGWENDIGLLPKRNGATKTNPSEHEVAEGRLSSDPNKVAFHYTDNLELLLIQNGAPIDGYRIFLDALHWFNSAGRLIAQRIVDEDTAERIGRGVTTTRILRYGPFSGIGLDSDLHRDRGCITIHWYSSREGLILFDRDSQRVRVRETKPDWICAFPGIKYWGLTRSAFEAAVHGVQDPYRNQPDGRHVIVTFVHAALLPEEVQWMKTHMPAIDRARYAL